MTVAGSDKYSPKLIEERWYSFWEDKNIFHAAPDSARKPYSIVIPPPNVTGALHMGHALNNIIQDILIRWRRMQGYNALWMPGTDHAGIATQNVVERELAKSGSSREAIGRGKFIKKVWEWKENYGSTITKQLKKLGSSCDWERERFTMDDGLSMAVRETFVRLYRKGLIYKGHYVINWCPRCKTALADDEVEHEDHDGHLWHIKYPFRDEPHLYLTVATTRPETMLGDVAVAVNPNDNRYKAMIGKTLILPVIQREIPVIGDDHVDIKFGTGAVKITPAHDNNDFEMALRHDLKPIIVMNDDGTMNTLAGDYNGTDRYECREALVEELKLKELMAAVEPHAHSVGHCYRCYTVIEPYLSNQWFIKMKPLARPAIEAVVNNDVAFSPARWTKVYLSWLENVRDWCISRQIWWGHRIPAWHCQDCGEINVDTVAPEQCANCNGTMLRQDDDVLDTWFSSALWPFSTMGWPEKTAELDYYYPTSTLVTDRGIIYFWVARMVMMGIELMDEKPFSNVYIHGTILDEAGRKMSKSLGNGIDPLEMIDQYGADAVRVSLIMLTTEGQDVKLSESKFEMGRNFVNKLWNAARFTMLNIGKDLNGETPEINKNDYRFEDLWIISRLNHTIGETTDLLEKFKFNEAIRRVYDFFWHEFCDWYLEIIKPRLYGNGNGEGADTATKPAKNKLAAQDTLICVLDKTLRLLHPFVPFLTEELRQRLKETNPPITDPVLKADMSCASIMNTAWPAQETGLCSQTIEDKMSLLQSVVRAVRNVRSKMNILEKQKLDILMAAPVEKDAEILKQHGDFLRTAGNIDKIDIEKQIGNMPEDAAIEVVGNIQILVPLTGVIDLDVERERQRKKLAELQGYLKIVRGKLGNEGFMRKAPQAVVQKEQKREKELLEQIDKLRG